MKYNMDNPNEMELLREVEARDKQLDEAYSLLQETLAYLTSYPDLTSRIQEAFRDWEFLDPEGQSGWRPPLSSVQELAPAQPTTDVPSPKEG